MTDVKQPYRFRGGPLDGQTRYQQQPSAGVHCMPTKNGTGAVWAAADMWPGQHRYVPDYHDGDVMVCMWRRASAVEIMAAKEARAARYRSAQHDEDE